MSYWTDRTRELLEAQSLLFKGMRARRGEVAKSTEASPMKLDKSKGWRFSSLSKLRNALEAAQGKAERKLEGGVLRVDKMKYKLLVDGWDRKGRKLGPRFSEADLAKLTPELEKAFYDDDAQWAYIVGEAVGHTGNFPAQPGLVMTYYFNKPAVTSSSRWSDNPTIVWVLQVWKPTKAMMQEKRKRAKASGPKPLSKAELAAEQAKKDMGRAVHYAQRSLKPRRYPKYEEFDRFNTFYQGEWISARTGDIVESGPGGRSGKFVGLNPALDPVDEGGRKSVGARLHPVIVWSDRETWAVDPDNSDEGTERDERRYESELRTLRKRVNKASARLEAL